MAKFLRFALIGALGFVVDAAVLTLMLRLGLDPYSGRLISFLAAASFTWLANRLVTFRAEASPDWLQEWRNFIAAMGLGGLVNYATYALLVATLPLFAQTPILAVAAGSIAGLFFNFAAASKLIFKSRA